MSTVKKARHDAKIPASTPQSPEEVLVLGRTGGHQAAVRQHDIRLKQVVNGQSILTGEITVAATEREAGDAGGGDNAGGYCQAE